MRALVAGLFLALTAVGVAWAQTGTAQAGQAGPPDRPAPRNLQVLPKDTSPQDVVALMQQFTRALGVQCTYCHVAGDTAAAERGGSGGAGGRRSAVWAVARGRGRGGPQMDYAADDKRQKQTARVMLALTNDINAKIATLSTPA